MQISKICKAASDVAKCANSLINTKKFKLAIFEIFRNLQNSPKKCQMHQFFDKYGKNSPLTNFQILEIRKIVPKITKYADSWRNTEKPEFSKFENFSR